MRYLFLLAVSTLFAQPPFVPADFVVPESYKTATFQLKPLGPDLAKHDYDAYMSSIEHLHKTFSPSGRWPNEKITMADAVKDVEGEIARFKARKSFTYAVLSLDGTRELGCVYISPSRKEGYDAAVRMWVTKAEYDKGLQPVVLKEVKDWLAKSWPFKNVLLPAN
ncbi:MAG TPA: hypothetical protein VFQ91_21470 [Bryobacteraceae bacterium]|nr:hypothetical protein [Bryobacteraceae bacterium]